MSIGQPGDVIVIAGKGNRDFYEYSDINYVVRRAWLDDRQEAMTALSQVHHIHDFKDDVDMTGLPWRYWTEDADCRPL